MKRIKYVQRAIKEELPDKLTKYKLTKLQEELLITRLDNKILTKFDYTSSDLINSKFNPLKNMDKLPDIELAGEVIAKAIKDKKHIVVVNDFDCDGISSGAVLYKSLEKVLHVDKENFGNIVNKRSTGTGYSKTLIARIIDYHNNVHNIDMIISSDHGSGDESSYVQLKEAGIGTLVITDHHHIDYDNYPKTADVFINPQRKDSKYYKEVSGCFIAYITMVSTYIKMHNTYRPEAFNVILPFVALSTISDVMSLKYPINRQVVKVGLNIMNSYKHTLWIVLKKLLRLNNRITSYDLGFKIGPLVNTANRMDVEELIMSIMLENDYNKLYSNASILMDMVAAKKAAQASGSRLANQQASSLKESNSIVVSIPSDYAINGIIASMVGGRHNKPTVCFIDNVNSDFLMGSGRGINDGINLVKLYDDINAEDDSILIKYGGHPLAAGCSIYKNKLSKFRELFDKYTVKQLGKNKAVDKIVYDKQLKVSDITLALTKEIVRIGPYGKDWDEPVFMTDAKVDNILVFGSMAKIFLKDKSGNKIDGICFFNNNLTGVGPDNIKELFPKGNDIRVTYTLGVLTNRDVVGINMVINTIDFKE